MFVGEVKVMVTDRGYVFYDITKIKGLPVNSGLTENDSAAASGNPSTNSIPDNEQTVNNNSMQESGEYSSSDLQSTAAESTRPAFTVPEKSEIYRPLTPEDRIEAAFGRDRSSKQKQIESIAEKFGMTVYWNERYSGAVYSPKDKSIRMNPNLTLTQAYMVVFKHEFMHHLEGFKGYDGFKNYLIKQSNAFEAYVRGALEKENGQAFEGTREEAIKAYTDIVFDKRRAAEEIPVAIRKAYTREEIEREIVADFTGEVLLFGENTEKSEQALLEVAETNRTLLQKIMDWIKDVISIIKGDPHNRTLEEDLRYLNQRIARVYDSAQKNTAKNSGEVKFKITNETNIIDLSENNELSILVDGVHGSMRYNLIKDYILKELQNQPIILSDGRKAVVDKNDAKHIASGAGNKRTAQISQLKKIIEVAELVAEEKSSKEHKFDYFYYYQTFVKYKKEKFAIYVNVGRARNDASLHIYDITQKLRDTAHRINDVGRPVGNALKSSISINSIPDNESTVNNNSMQKSKENTSKESFSVASEEFTTEMNKLTADFKEGKISIDEYTAGVSKLAENERKVSGELRQAMAEMEKNHAAQYMDRRHSTKVAVFFCNFFVDI